MEGWYGLADEVEGEEGEEEGVGRAGCCQSHRGTKKFCYSRFAARRHSLKSSHIRFDEDATTRHCRPIGKIRVSPYDRFDAALHGSGKVRAKGYI
jgi:hypothetical protein